MTSAKSRIRVRLRGIVQGVGFRPFVYNLAQRLHLTGYVLNSSAGLVAEAEGPPAQLDAFLQALTAEAPPLAWVQDLDVAPIAPLNDHGFTIRESLARAGEFALISPDVATCEDCLRDIATPSNRRFGYAFTNCTNCGPRYSIIRDIPYDRPSTTMAPFRMCPACRQEYDDPADRRFHAQPNACPLCGPALSASLAEAHARLAAGEILAIKGLGGFQLACDARLPAAVQRLRDRKRRSDKPFALMARDVAAVEEFCVVSEPDRQSITSPRRPIVILPRRSGSPLPDALAPGNGTLGVMLPYTPLHHLLLAGAGPLVMTSGNLSEEPIVVGNAEAQKQLAGVADWFLLHNRDIYMRVDDSVVRTFEGVERVVRRARGYAPQVMDLGRDVPELLAVGGELKNAFCLTKGRHAILSQHIGDLENYETLEFFQETLTNLKKLFRVEPRLVAHDLHPQYLSTRFALESGLPAVAVQHHHAHVASCMVEHGLTGQVIGVALDGTGFGPDGAIWGGEFLVAGYAAFERRAHFRYVPLPGGDRAVREPWRMALSYLMDTFGPDAPFATADERSVRFVRQMIAKGVGTIPTSSCGRLFDAVAATIGLRSEVTFEGQAAIELEAIADDGITAHYPFDIVDATPYQIDFRLTIAAIARDTGQSAIAAKFHNTVAAAIVETCVRIRDGSALRCVCLTGGTFQNMRLLATVVTALRRRDFTVFTHAKVPPNDGGIALGQAAVAAAQTGQPS